MYTIEKKFSFDAAHQLEGLPSNHPCTRLHGHTYEVIIQLSSQTLNTVGFVVDYRELSVVKDYIDNTLDHRHLNDILDVNPTAENIAKHLYEKFKKMLPALTSVIVKETPKTAARYAPGFDK